MSDLLDIRDDAIIEGQREHAHYSDMWDSGPRDSDRAPWLWGRVVYPTVYGRPRTGRGRVHRAGWITGWNIGRDAWVAEHPAPEQP